MISVMQPSCLQTVSASHIHMPHTAGNMPVDYAPYLFSASPPGFDLHYTLRDHFGLGTGSRNSRFAPLRPIILHTSSSDPDLYCKNFQEEEEEVCSPTETDEDCCFWSCDDLELPKLSVSSPHLDIPSPISPKTSRKMRKHVSFADDLGLNLVSVRIMTESSDMPPKLRTETLSSLACGASIGVTVTPPLVLMFNQPASDYLAFREKLEKNCVSLENVILKDYTLMGSVKVKNISFDKSVKIRCTYDAWKSFEEIETCYVPNSGSEGLHVPFDTFSFTINVPPTMDIKKTVEFAVCYEVANTQYWDNNDGSNYVIVSEQWKRKSEKQLQSPDTDNPVFSLLTDSEGWTEFSSWHHSDSSVPYY